MVVGVGEPGVKEWGEGVAEPKPVTKRPGGDHEERGEEEVNEIAQERRAPGKEAGPGGPARTRGSAPQRQLSIGELLGCSQPAAGSGKPDPGQCEGQGQEGGVFGAVGRA